MKLSSLSCCATACSLSDNLASCHASKETFLQPELNERRTFLTRRRRHRMIQFRNGQLYAVYSIDPHSSHEDVHNHQIWTNRPFSLSLPIDVYLAAEPCGVSTPSLRCYFSATY
ncbi:hypothetical protein ACLKA6_014139 [Drosophila palustris]